MYPGAPGAYPQAAGVMANVAAPPPRATGEPAAGQKKQKNKHLKLIIGIIAAVVAIALVVGGIIWYKSTPRGAKSAEAALTRMIDHINAHDISAVLRDFSPADMQYIQSVKDGALAAAQDLTGGNAAAEAQQAVKDMLAAVDYSLTDIKYDEYEVGDGITIFGIKDGTMRGEVKDIDAFVNAAEKLLSVGAEAEAEFTGQLRSSFESAGQYYDGPEPTSQRNVSNTVSELRNALKDESSGSVDLGEIFENGGEYRTYPVSVVTVREGNGWFVSPLLNVFSNYGLGLQLSPDELEGVHGVKIPEPVHYRSAEEAATGILTAMEEGDTDAYLGSFPLAERRARAISVAPTVCSGSDDSNCPLYWARGFHPEYYGMLFWPFGNDLYWGIPSFRNDDRRGRVSLGSAAPQFNSYNYAGHQRVVPTQVKVSTEDNLAYVDTSISGGKFTWRYEQGDSSYSSPSELSLDMSALQSAQYPLAGVSAVKDGEGWHVSWWHTLIDSVTMSAKDGNLDTFADFMKANERNFNF